jgi:predicted transcriptional regulator
MPEPLQLSPVAIGLWGYVQLGGRMHIEELKSALKASKTAILNAAQELADAGLLDIDIEEEDGI